MIFAGLDARQRECIMGMIHSAGFDELLTSLHEYRLELLDCLAYADNVNDLHRLQGQVQMLDIQFAAFAKYIDK